MDAFAAVAVFILLFGVVSGRLKMTVITAPMVFVAFGLLIGPHGLALITLDVEDERVRLLAELTLVIVLFTDAARIDIQILRRQYHLPLRMLAIGMPLMIVFGALAVLLLQGELEFWEAVVLAAVLTPTDAALGQVVVSSPQVPVRIRQALNVESGLNDGIAAPIILIVLSLASLAEGSETVGFWTTFTLKQVLLGPLVGILTGYIGGQLVTWGTLSEWMDHAFQRLSGVALALFAFAFAEVVGGNGFIAAFVAGLTMGNTAREICTRLYDFGEAEGQLLSLLTFTSFGAVMVVPVLEVLDASIVLYALLSLTVVRIVPVILSLSGLGLNPRSILFLGWFGPRGIATIIFALVVLERELTHGEEIFEIAMLTVLFSVFAHGLSAWPASNRYGAHAEAMRGEPNMPELEAVDEMPVRISM